MIERCDDCGHRVDEHGPTGCTADDEAAMGGCDCWRPPDDARPRDVTVTIPRRVLERFREADVAHRRAVDAALALGLPSYGADDRRAFRDAHQRASAAAREWNNAALVLATHALQATQGQALQDRSAEEGSDHE